MWHLEKGVIIPEHKNSAFNMCQKMTRPKSCAHIQLSGNQGNNIETFVNTSELAQGRRWKELVLLPFWLDALRWVKGKQPQGFSGASVIVIGRGGMGKRERVKIENFCPCFHIVIIIIFYLWLFLRSDVFLYKKDAYLRATSFYVFVFCCYWKEE